MAVKENILRPWVLLIALVAGVGILFLALWLGHELPANEINAIEVLQKVNLAEFQYRSTHQQIGYSCDPVELARSYCAQRSGCAPAPANPAPLFKSVDVGYHFDLRCKNANGKIIHYQVVAVPEFVNNPEGRQFCTDESQEIRFGYRGECRKHFR